MIFNESKDKELYAMARITFLKALQYRIGRDDGGRYSFEGVLTHPRETPAAVFRMTSERKTQ